MSHLARSNPARLRRVPMSRWLPTLSLACALLVPAFAETVVKFGEELEKVDPDVQAIELKLKLGAERSTSRIRKYMTEGGGPQKSPWRTFFSSHAN